LGRSKVAEMPWALITHLLPAPSLQLGLPPHTPASNAGHAAKAGASGPRYALRAAGVRVQPLPATTAQVPEQAAPLLPLQASKP